VELQVVAGVGDDGQFDGRLAGADSGLRRQRDAVAQLGAAISAGEDRDTASG